MATIQWFPGHMAKARREVTEKLKLVDMVIELVDARLPLSSRNPMMDQIIQQKPRLIVLNKADLADSVLTKQWLAYFEQQGLAAVAMNANANKGTKAMIAACKDVLKEQRERRAAKGMKPKAIRAMIIGIPNVGKSTLLNRLVGKKIAKTGNKPGVTKAQQWLKVNGELELLDTPGILWPKFDDEETGLKLALTGAIKDDLLHLDDVALYALDYFIHYHPQALKDRYSLADTCLLEPLPELLMAMTAKRGFRDDYDRMSQLLIHEIRDGKLGRYTLDLLPVEGIDDSDTDH